MKNINFLIMLVLLVPSLSTCRNYIVDRPLNPGMTKEEVKQQWGDTGRKEFMVLRGQRVDLWYYKFGMSNRLYTVVFVDEKLIGFYSRYIGPQHIKVHHSGSINIY